MSALILKSANHLYKIFKVYFALAIFGALAVIVVGLFLAKPIVLLGTGLVITTLCIVSVLWTQAQEAQTRKTLTRMLDSRHSPRGLRREWQVNLSDVYISPPKLPESLLFMMLPRDMAEAVLGDLSEEYRLLSSRYGRQSANSWYVIECIYVIFYSVGLHLRLVDGKDLTRFLKKDSANRVHR